MAAASRVYLFGDQTGDFDAGLRRLLQAKNNSLVTSFFERCFYALRHEIAQLSPTQRQIFPRFTSVVDLLARYRESGPNPALESALTCIYQLGCFINYYGDGGQTYPLGSESYIVGLCTGLLASAAVSSSRTIGELIPLAVETVVLALRLGLCVLKVRELVDQNGMTGHSWSMVVSGIQKEKALALREEFCHIKAIPPSSKPYISAINSHSLTISGPPKILEEFTKSCLSGEHKPVKVQIHAPYHAPHLYDSRDVDRILEKWSREDFVGYVPQIPVLSNTTGEPIKTESLEVLLRIALEEILLRQLSWDKILDGCSSVLKLRKTSTCKIFPIATTASHGLTSALKRSGISDVTVDNGIAESLKRSEAANSTGRSEQSKIAIIGLSGRFPDAANPERFWDILYKGLDVHREVPPDRWDVKAHVDLSGKRKNTSRVPYGCWIEEPGLFDPRFFNMSPREALQADPAQRLALVTAYEALEMAGFVPDSTPSTQKNRVGIFYGMTSDDYREVNSGQDIDTYFIPGGNRAFTPGRINYFFKFSGPSVSVDTACSSSLAAIHMACNSLWRNDCDTAIAGGVNVLTNPDNFAGLDRGHFLSRKGNCNTFDDGADGYCRADAVGTVILKRLEDAQADNDPILGVIVGAYTNHSAEAVSMTRPHVGAQAFIFDKLLNEADVNPLEISYIEMHGTGTQAGDAVEMKSVLDIFAPDYRRGPGQSLHLGSAKANVGHSESASGVTSLIKVLLMMKNNMIPPHCGIKTKINHNFPTDLKERNVHIASKPIPWQRPEGSKRKVFLNNFSAAGGNTALLVEDAPARCTENARDPRSTHVVAVTARSKSSLINNIESLVRYIDENSRNNDEGLLSKLSYTTTARRMHHSFRTIVSGSNLREVRDALLSSARRENINPVPASPPNIGFIFTGQGSQYTGMGKQLYEHFSQFRANVQHFDRIGRSQGFPSILPLIDGSVPIEELSPLVTQLGTTCMQMALARLWVSLGARPAFVLGHSLGEYAALNVAGVLTTSDTIYLSGRRTQLLTEKCQVGTHSMLAIKASLAQVKPYLDDQVHEVACINAPGETVVSGLSNHIDALSEKLTAERFKSTKLRVPYAFHSAQVESILERLESTAQGVTFHKPLIPIVSALLGEVITEDKSDLIGPNYLKRHCRETVKFLAALEATRHAKLMSDKTLWIEIGSHTVCSGMIKATLGPQVNTVASLRRGEDTWKVLANSLSSLYLAGIDIQWREYHQDFSSSHQVLHLPAYSWDNKNYWIPYNNNFCLTKGDPTVAKIEAEPTHQSLTTSVQKIVETHGDGSRATVVMQSDMSDPLLRQVIHGHKVNGAALCPSSLYADIAQTLAEYLIEKYKPELKGSGLDVGKMTVPKPLIAKESGEHQLFRASATADWVNKRALVQIYSVNADGKKTTDHASCTVKFSDCSVWEQEFKRITYLIKRSIERLQKSAKDGQCHRMQRGMAYKLFSALVEYDDNYKSIEEVILDSEEYEATAHVKFQAKPGNFHRNPFWIDSLGHITGFVMNANDAVDSRTQVFVNHGWDSMRCLKKFSADATYRTYVKMQPWEGTIYAGDVYVLEGNDIIAVYGGVKFQGIPRRLLDTVIPPAGSSKSSAKVLAKTPPASISVEKSKSAVKTKSRTQMVNTNSPVKSPGPSILIRALAILATEIGVPESELSDDLVFADYGVDSLLSLTIAGKFREELEIDIDSSVFMDHPTIKDFKRLLAQMSPSDSGESSEESRFSVGGSSSTEPSTPGEPEDFRAPGEKAIQTEENDILKTIRSILSEEIGVSPEEITGDTNLGEMGMDSLLSLTVLGKLRETLDLDLPGDFFMENQTLNDIETALDLKPKMPEVCPGPPEPIQAAATTTTVKTETVAETKSKPVHPPATSILLQGNPKTATKTLFLFPDGSGSATSYATIPAISSDVCVYGLNCPYMKTPENLKCGLADLTGPYVAEIRRRQPKGPYNLGGWSAGGICAYDAARHLIFEEGEKVDRLLLLDSPFPVGLEKLPPRLYDFFNSIGLFGEGKTPPPKWLLPHFLAFIDALDTYKAVPFPPSDKNKLPKTYLVWAKDGVCGKPGDPRPAPPPDGSKDPREMLWLLNDRTDLGPNGWDGLVGEKNVALVEVLEGANHFTMMKGDKARELAGFIGKAMAN